MMSKKTKATIEELLRERMDACLADAYVLNEKIKSDKKEVEDGWMNPKYAEELRKIYYKEMAERKADYEKYEFALMEVLG